MWFFPLHILIKNVSDNKSNWYREICDINVVVMYILICMHIFNKWKMLILKDKLHSPRVYLVRYKDEFLLKGK